MKINLDAPIDKKEFQQQTNIPAQPKEVNFDDYIDLDLWTALVSWIEKEKKYFKFMDKCSNLLG